MAQLMEELRTYGSMQAYGSLMALKSESLLYPPHMHIPALIERLAPFENFELNLDDMTRTWKQVQQLTLPLIDPVSVRGMLYDVLVRQVRNDHNILWKVATELRDDFKNNKSSGIMTADIGTQLALIYFVDCVADMMHNMSLLTLDMEKSIAASSVDVRINALYRSLYEEIPFSVKIYSCREQVHIMKDQIARNDLTIAFKAPDVRHRKSTLPAVFLQAIVSFSTLANPIFPRSSYPNQSTETHNHPTRQHFESTVYANERQVGSMTSKSNKHGLTDTKEYYNTPLSLFQNTLERSTLTAMTKKPTASVHPIESETTSTMNRVVPTSINPAIAAEFMDHNNGRLKQRLSTDRIASHQVGEMMETARTALINFRHLLDDIASSHPFAQKKVAPLKGFARLLEKVSGELKGKFEGLTDIVRGTLLCDNTEQVYKLVDAVVTNEQIRVVSVKDRFQKPLPSGYRDIQLILVDLASNHLTELQINIHSVHEIKETQGHVLYEQMRSIEDRADIEQRTLNADEIRELNELNSISRNLYNEAIQTATASAAHKKHIHATENSVHSDEVVLPTELPENPSIYFDIDNRRPPRMINVQDLIPERKRANGVASARRYMTALAHNTVQAVLRSNGSRMILKKRPPITVCRIGTSNKYRVVDGNSTYQVAKENGWIELPVLLSLCTAK